ncbi:RING finger protein 37 [Chamberlinius hualienensis]
MDVCCESLGTTVISSQVTSDGFEVSNLISSNPKSKQAGFIAERFIKPPVDIVFTFPCEIQLNYIHLLTCVGSQKSVGIDISSYAQLTKNERNACDNNSLEEIFLGKCFISNEADNQMVLFNRLFINRPPFDSLNSASVPECGISRTMRLSQAVGVNRVIKLKIRLWKTANGSLPCLGKVVINGIPNRYANKQTIERLLALAKRNLGITDAVDDQPVASTSNNASTSSITNKSCEGLKLKVGIPDDFLDPITCEIMSYPVVLPSGNVVDQTTLDKHISTEAAWGRLPSDLFTGLPFTKDRRALPNMALKSRIDQFLLKNSCLESELTLNGRTLGKRKRYEEVFPSKMSTTCNRNAPNENGGGIIDKRINKTTHQLELEQSLKEALKTASENRNASSKSLTIFKSPLACVSCKVATKDNCVFYRLPCNHEMCRTCISKIDRTLNRCSTCQTTYKSIDIQRSY